MQPINGILDSFLDPDFRAARQQHPWIVINDNHEVSSNFDDPVPRQAMLEWVPIRLLDPNNHFNFYRDFKYGDLVEIFMIDINTHRDQDAIPGGGMSILGDEQYNWLLTKLQQSTAKWVLIGQQKIVGGWSLLGLPDWFPGDGLVFSEKSWDGNEEARNRLLNEIENMGRDNVIFLSGDTHMSLGMDVTTDPYNSNVYNPNNGNGSIAVEFMPPSISRGNFDERVDLGDALIDAASGLSELINVHHLYSEFVSHGYGILDIQEGRAVGEYWYSEYLQPEMAEKHSVSLTVYDGENHWDRNIGNNALPPKEDLPFLSFDSNNCLPYNDTAFSTECTTVCWGDPVHFYNNLIPQHQELNKEYIWDFGDGTSSNLAQPLSHEYAQDGTFDISLTVNNYVSYLNQITITNANCDDLTNAADIYVVIRDPGTNGIYTSSVNNNSNLPISFSPNQLVLDNSKLYELRVKDSDDLDNDDTCGFLYFTIKDNGTIANEDIEVTLDISPQLLSTQTYSSTITILPQTHPDCITSIHLPNCLPFSDNNFALSCTNICTRDSIQVFNFLSQQSSDYQKSYNWNFGNGLTSTKPDPGWVHFDVAGTYTITFQETITQKTLTKVRVNEADCSDDIFSGNVDLFITVDDPVLNRIYKSSTDNNDSPPVNFNNLDIPLVDGRMYYIRVIDDDPLDNEFCGALFFTSDSPFVIENNNISLEMTFETQVISDLTFTQDVIVNNCENCPEQFAGNFALTGDVIQSRDYETDGLIESTQKIFAGTQVDYNTGTAVCMTVPFEVELGSVFHAYIEGCPDSVQTITSPGTLISPY